MADAELIFPPGYTDDGFNNNVTTHFPGKHDSVVRELVQNGLDAVGRRKDHEKAEIQFTIADVEPKLIPGFETLATTFHDARKYREGLRGKLSRPEGRTIAHLESAYQRKVVPVLFCRDNGIGLNKDSIVNVLTESNSDKIDGGAGSHGLGHLTTFAASGSQYVLYAGRSRGKRTLRDVVAGHAILADFERRNQRHAKDGYWKLPSRNGAFNLRDGRYPDVIVPMFKEEFTRIADTGTVVAITGFSFFGTNKSTEDAVKAICEAAAINFLVAIVRKALTVSVAGSRTGRPRTIDASTIKTVLSGVAQQRRAGSQGWLAGSQASRALETMAVGDSISVPEIGGCEIWFRSLPSSEDTRVQVFRDGMWITNRAPRLEPHRFNDSNRFDAVINLTRGRFYDLVRDSEGAEHRGIDMSEFDADEKKELRGFLDAIAAKLREAAGKLDTTSGYVPDGFAVIEGTEIRTADVVPPVDADEPPPPAPDPPPPPVPDPPPPTPPLPPGPLPPGPLPPLPPIPTPEPPRPRPGKDTSTPVALVPIDDADGAICELKAHFEISEDSPTAPYVGLRVRVATGSDETSDVQATADWCKLSRATVGSQDVFPVTGDPYEIRLVAQSTTLTIHLAEPYSDSAPLELSIVPRNAENVAHA